jgi:hypothetical protein
MSKPWRHSGSLNATSTGSGRSITLRWPPPPFGIGFPVEQTSYWRSLSTETVWELKKRMASFRLSNFLHGEQGALMVAAQLVNAVPHTDAKFYAATQTIDEARHVEARYIQKLDMVRPIAPNLKGLLASTLETGDWTKKLVGMQIVVEGSRSIASVRCAISPRSRC